MPRPPIYEDVEFREVVPPQEPEPFHRGWPEYLIGFWLACISGMLVMSAGAMPKILGAFIGLLALGMLGNAGQWVLVIGFCIFVANR